MTILYKTFDLNDSALSVCLKTSLMLKNTTFEWLQMPTAVGDFTCLHVGDFTPKNLLVYESLVNMLKSGFPLEITAICIN